VIEALDRVLPAYDDELTRPVAASLRKLGVRVRLGCTVEGLNADGDAVRVRDAAGDVALEPADRVLVAVGRRPGRRAGASRRWVSTWTAGPSGSTRSAGPRCAASGRSATSRASPCSRTGRWPRARWWPRSSAVIASLCAGGHAGNLLHGPRVVVVGMTPGAAAASGRRLHHRRVSVLRERPLADAGIGGGFVRVVARRDNHLIVGWQAVGHQVAELSTAFSHSIEMGARLEDAAATNPRPSDPGRGGPGGGTARAGEGAARLIQCRIEDRTQETSYAP